MLIIRRSKPVLTRGTCRCKNWSLPVTDQPNQTGHTTHYTTQCKHLPETLTYTDRKAILTYIDSNNETAQLLRLEFQQHTFTTKRI